MKTNWNEQHAAATRAPRSGFERWWTIANALGEYCQAYVRTYGDVPSHDAILGDEGVARVIDGLCTMLNGDLGRLDSAECWTELDRIAKIAGWRDIDHAREDSAS